MLRAILILAALLFPALSFSQSAVDDLQAGFNALSNQNGPEAVKMLKLGLGRIKQDDKIPDNKVLEAKIGLATAYILSGQVVEAENTAISILPRVKQSQGEKSLNYVSLLEIIALANQLSGQYLKSLEYYEKLVELHPYVADMNLAYRARVLSTKSLVHKELGQFIEAMQSEELALSLLLELNPKGSDAAINSFVQLAYLADQSGDSDAELTYLQKQYDMQVALYGDKNPTAIQTKQWIIEKRKNKRYLLAGDDSGSLGSFTLEIINLGVINIPEKEAENLAKSVKQFGADHPLTLGAMGRFADSNTVYGKMDKAITYYNLVIERNKELFPVENAELANLYLRLSNAYSNIFGADDWQANHTKALESAQTSVDIYSRLYGDAHLRTIIALKHLWQLKSYEPKKSQKSFKLALRIWKGYSELERRTLPYMSKQQRVGFRQNFSGLQDAFLQAAWVASKEINDETDNESRKYWDQSVKNVEDSKKAKSWDETVALWGEQKRTYEVEQKKQAEIKAKNDNKIQEVIYSLYDEWVNYKGGVNAVENSLNIARLNSANDMHLSMIEKLLALRNKLAIQRSARDTSTSASESISIQKEISSLQIKLYSEIPSLQLDARFHTRDLVKTLDKDMVFVDFARYSKNEYMAFIVEPTGKTTIRRLTGDVGGYWGGVISGAIKGAGEINKGITKVRNDIDGIIDGDIEFSGSEKQLLSDLDKLYDQIILPLEDVIKNYTTVVVSPDSMLSLLPFSMLHNKRTGKYLVENHTVRSIPSAREWLRLKNNTPSDKSIMTSAIYANPDFNAGSKITPKQCASAHSTRSVRELLMKTFADDCIIALPATEDEARSVSIHIPRARSYLNKNATEEALLKEKSPRILHLATHGFFIPDPGIINPLEKGGVILSGANTSLSIGETKGIVTGMKLAAMDLTGTELVVLSACETGIGDVQNGEGVAGLNQAFIRAGARGIVMSLWRVPDKPTAELMSSLYKAMSKGKATAAALRDAQLNFIKQKAHPLAWAAFIYNG